MNAKCLWLLGPVMLAGLAWAAPDDGVVLGDDLSQAEIDGLLFMREEEKLARDVYVEMYDLWQRGIFSNISASEQQHMDAVLTLLKRYDLPDPAEGKAPGEFKNQDLQALYDQLIAQGSKSVDDAFRVGVLIEETDIADLRESLKDVTHRDLRQVYTNLLRASQNHLRAFRNQLDVVAGQGQASAGTAGQGTPDGFGGGGRGMGGLGGRGGCGQGFGHKQCRHGGGVGERVVGIVDAIDPGKLQITVGETTVQVTKDTVIRIYGKVGTFEDLEVGQNVCACGRMDGGVLLAARICVRCTP